MSELGKEVRSVPEATVEVAQLDSRAHLRDAVQTPEQPFRRCRVGYCDHIAGVGHICAVTVE